MCLIIQKIDLEIQSEEKNLIKVWKYSKNKLVYYYLKC